MPRGQTPTPRERAEKELADAQAGLDRLVAKVAKMKDERARAAAKVAEIDAEIDGIKAEAEYEHDRVALLRRHPLLGGTGAPAQPAYQPPQPAQPVLHTTIGSDSNPTFLNPQANASDDAAQAVEGEGLGRPAAEPQPVFAPVAEPVVTQSQPVIQTGLHEPRQPAAPAAPPAPPTEFYVSTPRDPSKRPEGVVPDFDESDPSPTTIDEVEEVEPQQQAPAPFVL